MVEVKVCGLCRPRDAAAAVRAGAAYVGVVLTRGFPRTQSVERAGRIFLAAERAAAAIAVRAGVHEVGGVARGAARRGSQAGTEPPGPARSAVRLQRVGVFVNASESELGEAAERLGLDVLQLHGAEPPNLVAAARADTGRSVWKVLRPRSRAEFSAGLAAYAAAVDGLLIDGWTPETDGGAGVRFPWTEVEEARTGVPSGVRLIVAGGLTPDNVGEAVARLAPDVVDVSSGVEAALGRKSVVKVRQFIRAAQGTGR